MNTHRTFRIAVIALTILAAPAVAGAANVQTSKTGMTIYTFDQDAPGSGKSACRDACLALWPAVPVAHAPASGGDFGSLTREDGTKQLTYKGRPVYYYVQDRKPGDVSGDKVGGVWHVIDTGASSNAKDPGAKPKSSYGY